MKFLSELRPVPSILPLLFDAPALHFLKQVGDCFAQDTRHLLFWQNASEAVVAQFYSAVLALEESSNLERLKIVLVSPASTCSPVSSSPHASCDRNQPLGEQA
jgi:hypothetical protein